MVHSPIVTAAAACPSLTELARALHERADAAANRQHILVAARQLFEQRGVEQVTMDEIARAAGVGKGTLYRRYPDKAALVVELMDACFVNFERETLTEIEASSASTLAIDQLQAFLDPNENANSLKLELVASYLDLFADPIPCCLDKAWGRSIISGWAHAIPSSPN